MSIYDSSRRRPVPGNRAGGGAVPILWGVLCAWSCVPLDAAAQDHAREAPLRAPARVRVRHDTVLRYLPRYELTVDNAAASSSSRYWRRIDELPIYELLSLDADGLREGTTEAHISAWGAWDLTIPEDGDVLSGDFATAWARTRMRPFALWAGRRFVTWGVPGGLHVDGLGVELQTDFGLHVELIGGRPVSAVGTTLGSHSEFESPKGVYGVRVGYEEPGTLAASVSYLERWMEGIAADRAIMGTVSFRPFSRLDMLATATFDVNAGVEEARAQIAYLIVDELEPDIAYIHADPQKLLPAWSLLSMFATAVYDEAELGATVRVSEQVAGRAELALRHSYVPGGNDADTYWGYRANLLVRWRPVVGRTEFVGEVSRRNEADTTLMVGRLGAAFEPIHPLRLAATIGVAADEHDSERTALLLRGAAEMPFGSSWSTALTVDVARTPIALEEVRALLRLSYELDREVP